MKYIVEKEKAGERLDVYLAGVSGETRSAVQKRMEAHLVSVNGSLPKKSGYRVVEGDVIELGEMKKIVKKKNGAPDPTIIEETPEYVVIGKPAGLVVHTGVNNGERTVVDFILEKYPQIKGVGDDPLRPGIVHRLDKDASGVMVVARTQDSFDSLKRQFKLRRVTKEYLILVHGEVTPREGVIDIPITRSASHSTKFVGSMAGGRDALTNYAVERTMDGYSLVRVRPETGRTHQIRVHFYSRGYPLVGDRVYVGQKTSQVDARLMLHAVSLEFRDLLGVSRMYEYPPERDFMEVIERIESAT